MKKGILGRRFAVIAGGAAIVAMLGGFGTANAGSNGKKIEISFDLSKCEPQGPNLYKCPAVDKPVCTKEFNQPNVECIRVGKKGNVFVMVPGAGVD